MTDEELKAIEERAVGPWGDFEVLARADVRELVREVRRLHAGWISVKDRLPFESEEVFLVIKSGYTQKIEIGNFEFDDNLGGRFIDRQYNTFDGEVTHWMHQPELPAQEAK